MRAAAPRSSPEPRTPGPPTPHPPAHSREQAEAPGSPLPPGSAGPVAGCRMVSAGGDAAGSCAGWVLAARCGGAGSGWDVRVTREPLFLLQHALGMGAGSAWGATPPPPPFPQPCAAAEGKTGPAAGIDVTEKVLARWGHGQCCQPLPQLPAPRRIVPQHRPGDPAVQGGLGAALAPSHLAPPHFLIAAAISSMAPAQHVTSLQWGGCAGGGGGVGEEAVTGGLVRWKIPLLPPLRPRPAPARVARPQASGPSGCSRGSRFLRPGPQMVPPGSSAAPGLLPQSGCLSLGSCVHPVARRGCQRDAEQRPRVGLGAPPGAAGASGAATGPW